MRVVFESAQVLAEIGAAIDWWRTNRDKAPSALEDELDEAISDLEAMGALLGLPVRNMLLPNVRRLHLKRTRYFLYFRARVELDTIEILSLWHTSRGTRPVM